MMTTTQIIQDVIYQGYGVSAQVIGDSYGIYRSSTPINPIVPGNLITTQNASFNVDWTYKKANKYGNAVWQTLSDGRNFQVGDYFIKAPFPEQRFFVAAMQRMLPILSVECNKTVTITRAAQDNAPDSDVYSGYVPPTVTTLAQNLPVSMLYQNHGSDNKMKLPTDTRLPRWIMLLPNLGSVVYKNRDIVIDELNMRYVIISVELTDLGWRMVMEQLGA